MPQTLNNSLPRHTLLASALDQCQDAVFLENSQRRFVYVNAAACARLGYSADELQEMGRPDIDPDVTWEDLHKAQWVPGIERRFQSRHRTRSGQLISVEVNGACISVDGQLYLVLIARDITDRKLTEQHFKQTLSLLQGVIDAFPDFLFESNKEGRYLNVWTKNPELLATSREQLLGRTLDEVLSPDSAEIANAAIQEADRTGQSFGKVIRIETSVGVRWFELSVSKMAIDDFHDPHFITVSRDVTARMELQAALTREEQKFRSLVEHSPDATARFAPDLRCLYANPALARQLGRAPDALYGMRPVEFIGPLAGGQLEETLDAVFSTGERSDLELHWVDVLGQSVCSLVSLSPEFDASGTVASVLAVGRDISELRVYQDKIHQMAFYDPLTGLANRVLFNDRLAQMVAEASWHQQVAGVMIVDMDRFKQINDTLGHAAGDELLKEVSNRLRHCVRTYDTVARLGGDEFGVLLSKVRDTESMSRVVHKVKSAFDRGYVLAGREVFVSCCIGVSVFPHDGTQGDELVKHADSAMYFAKRSGRNGFRFYSKDLTESAQERLTLEQALRRALERNELTLHFQPKVALRTGAVVGSEALLRWFHPQLGAVPPSQFIPVAEDAGLIVDIGAWVLRQACLAAAEWNVTGHTVHKVAVNLSARQLQTHGLLALVTQTLAETRCQAAWIELEITESLLLDEDGRVLQTLDALRAMGVTIAIDDFGTGYSALSYLTRFPIDTLKIDRSFIQLVTTDRYRAELVRAILSIAGCLNQQVVAEGVETAEQAEFLRAHGCELVQGYLYSRPLPQGEMARLGRVLKPQSGGFVQPIPACSPSAW